MYSVNYNNKISLGRTSKYIFGSDRILKKNRTYTNFNDLFHKISNNFKWNYR